MIPRFVPIADHALLVEFSDTISEAVTRQILDLDHALAQSPPQGLREVIPAMVNLLVEFDPTLTDHQQLQDAVHGLLDVKNSTVQTAQQHQVEVCYDAEFAPDLEIVAANTGLGTEAVINAHLGADYAVLMYGFAPGYAYMTGVPAAIQQPRKPAALRDIAAGSVLIAGPQCLVTTLKMPTGWSIIGRSPTQVLRADPDHPFLFDVGDHVTFKRIDRATFDARKAGR